MTCLTLLSLVHWFNRVQTVCTHFC